MRVSPTFGATPLDLCERAAGCRLRGIHVVSQEVVIRDDMAVQEPDIPTRGRRMSHCSRVEPA